MPFRLALQVFLMTGLAGGIRSAQLEGLDALVPPLGVAFGQRAAEIQGLGQLQKSPGGNWAVANLLKLPDQFLGVPVAVAECHFFSDRLWRITLRFRDPDGAIRAYRAARDAYGGEERGLLNDPIFGGRGKVSLGDLVALVQPLATSGQAANTLSLVSRPLWSDLEGAAGEWR